MIFKKISDCSPDLSQEELDSHIYLSFDIDWACDEVILDTIELVEKADVCATWFVTHETPTLERLRENPKFELGAHPNFNPRLFSSEPTPSIEETLQAIRKIVPEATAVRSHSMTQNSRIMDFFVEYGYTHDCNHFIPEQSEVELRPWTLWNGIIKIAHFWEDDATCLFKENNSLHKLLHRKGLKVFDFHPIHVFLNTEDLYRYESSRAIHREPRKLIYERYEGYGSRSYLEELLSHAGRE